MTVCSFFYAWELRREREEDSLEVGKALERDYGRVYRPVLS